MAKLIFKTKFWGDETFKFNGTEVEYAKPEEWERWKYEKGYTYVLFKADNKCRWVFKGEVEVC